MEMLNVVFACAVLGVIFPTGECYSWSTVYPTKTDYLPGESVSIHCAGSATFDENNVTVQFLKLGYYIQKPNGAYSEEYVVALATNDQIDSYVQQKAPGRYTASGSHTDTQFDYTYTINDLKLEDHGNFSCGIIVDGELNQGDGYAQVKVPGPVSKMAIMYGESRTDWENNPERDNPDNKITWVATDSGYYLTCMVQTTTSPLTEWSMTLYDPNTLTSTNLTKKFWDTYTFTNSTSDARFTSYVTDKYFLLRTPDRWDVHGELLGYTDSGKILKFTTKVEDYDEVVESSTVLDIQFSPVETSCLPRAPNPEASTGTRNFKLLCYTRSIPTANVTWKANDETLRVGITVENQVKGPYQVSVLTIDEVQESDFMSFSFEATNAHGTVTFPANGHTAWEIKKGSAVNQAPGVESGSYPWNTSKASTMSTPGTLLVLLVVFFVLY